MQKALGIQDSNSQFLEDTLISGHYKNDKSLAKKMVESSAEIVDWLQGETVGADLSDVGLMGGCTNKRTHRPNGGQAIGPHLIPKLYEAAKKAGAEIRLSNTVTDIISENGEPVGVWVQNENGSYNIKAKAIIIATGGFGANPQLIGKYRPDLQNYPTTNIRSAQGDAFAWVEKFDAELVLMNEIQTHPSVAVGGGTLITEAVRGNGAIMLDHKGRRFLNELETRDFVSEKILSLPEKTAFIFFNEEVRKSLKAVEEYVETGLLTEAATVEEMAQKLKMNPDILKETLDTYNASKSSGKDELFNRPDLPVSFETGPYYAVEVEPAIHNTMGGLKINTDAQVINKSGKPIPRLYAAGEVTGGVHGDNRIGGNAVAEICIFGRIAAKSACESIGY